MAPNPGRRWLIGAVALFLALLLGWVVLALQLNVASAGPLPYSPLLVSRLSADYGADALPRRMASVRLTILEDAMRALGMTDAEVEQRQSDIELAMSRPVPTATALNFSGDAPFTATPTFTLLPTETSTPTVTSSPTRRPPTRTPKPTKTPKPTNPPATPAPTSVGDTDDPVVDASGVIFSPPPGPISTCSLDISNVHITDAIGSSGIAEAGIKYDPPGPVPLFRTPGLSLLPGGGLQADTSWDGTYAGTITLTKASAGDRLDIYLYAKDSAGNIGFFGTDFDYDLTIDCP